MDAICETQIALITDLIGKTAFCCSEGDGEEAIKKTIRTDLRNTENSTNSQT